MYIYRQQYKYIHQLVCAMYYHPEPDEIMMRFPLQDCEHTHFRWVHLYNSLSLYLSLGSTASCPSPTVMINVYEYKLLHILQTTDISPKSHTTRALVSRHRL